MTFSPKYMVSVKIQQHLEKIDEIKHSFKTDFMKYDTETLTLAVLPLLRQQADLSRVYFSTQLAGNHLNLEEISKAIEGKPFPQEKETDAHMVQAYWEAYNYAKKAAKENHAFSKKMISRLHALINSDKNTQHYRKEQNVIYYDGQNEQILYLPPEPKDVPKLMIDYVMWVNSSYQMPAPLLAGIVHYQFVTISPYLNGNGRIAHLLTNFVMRQKEWNYPRSIFCLEEHYAKDYSAYCNALQIHQEKEYYQGRNTADITPWLEYFTAGMVDAYETAYAKAAALDPEMIRNRLEETFENQKRR